MRKMKVIYLLFILLSPIGFSQEAIEGAVEVEATDPDTTRITIGNTTFIIIENSEGEEGNNIEEAEWSDDMDPEDRDKYKSKRSSPHWAGLDLGVMMLMDQNMDNKFIDNPYWENNTAKSHILNLNILEKKLNFGTPFVGLTTGIGVSFTSVGFRDNYLLTTTADSVYGVIDTVNIYSKNKLKATYLAVPLLLEINTSRRESRSVYLAAGVVGGVRIASKLKKRGELDGKEFKQKEKGTYGLNTFKVDAAVRLGFGKVGAFANYSLLPLFDTDKTIEVYPLTFGLSMNF